MYLNLIQTALRKYVCSHQLSLSPITKVLCVIEGFRRGVSGLLPGVILGSKPTFQDNSSPGTSVYYQEWRRATTQKPLYTIKILFIPPDDPAKTQDYDYVKQEGKKDMKTLKQLLLFWNQINVINNLTRNWHITAFNSVFPIQDSVRNRATNK